jgi:excisionase family DNA binding protein
MALISKKLRVGLAALQLGVTPSTVRRLIADGKLAAVRVGREFRVDPAELARFVAEARTDKPAPSSEIL